MAAEPQPTRRALAGAVALVVLALAWQYRDGLLGRHWLAFDNAFQNFPWHWLIHQARWGRDVFAPLPEMANGFPLWAEPQADYFYPLNTAWWPWLGPYTSFTLKILLHLGLGTVGFWCLARREGLSPLGAATAVIVFVGGAFMVHRLKHPPVLQPLCWAPWVVLLVSRAMAGEGRRWLAAATGVMALQFLTGHPQMVLVTAVIAWLRGVAAVPADAGWLRRLARPTAALGLMGAAVLAMDLVKWLPASYHMAAGPRTGRATLEWMMHVGANAQEAMVNLFPGTPCGDVYEMTAFASTAAIVALGVALTGGLPRRWRLWTAIGLLGLFLAWAVGNPVYRVLVEVPLVNRFRAVSRYGVLWTFGGALLAGALVDQLGRLDRRAWARAAAVTAALLGGALAIVAVGDQVPTGLGVQAAALGAVGLAAGLARRRPAAARWLLALSLTAELLWGGRNVMPAATSAAYEASEDLVVFRRAAEVARADGSGVVTWFDRSENNASLLTGCRQPKAFTPFPLPGLEDLNILMFGPAPFTTLAAFGVGWIATDPPVARKFGLQPVRHLAGPWYLYRNPVQPLEAYVPRYLVPYSQEAGRTALRAADADPRDVVVVTGLTMPPGYVPGTPATVRIVSEQPREIVVEAASAAGMLVILSRCSLPDWTATIDGQPVPLAAANAILLAVPTPPGRHTIVLRYEPPLRDLLRASLVAWLVWLVALAAVWRQDRREGNC